MSDFKDSAISELTLLAGAFIASGDLLPIVDISDTAAGVTKQTTANDLTTAIITLGNITTQGNTFNSASKLVQLDGSGALVSGVITATNLTTQGNTFNAASKLVQLDSSTRLPAVDGSLVTTLNASAISSGTLADARLSANVTVQGNTFNIANKLVQLNSSGQLPVLSAINLTDFNANNINAGTVANARLSASVTLQGNTFNGVNQLVQLDGSTQLPAVSGVNLTNLNASAINSGALGDAYLSANVSLKVKPIVAIASATVYPLADINKDSIFVVGHASGLVNFNLQNSPAVTAGVSFTIVTNTVQAISFTCDTSVSAYYINQGGTGATVAPGATLAPSNQRGRVITITCVNTNTYVISGAGL